MNMVFTNSIKTIKQIKELKKIRPRKDWVLLTKEQILGEEKRTEWFPFFKPAYAGVIALALLFGLFEFSQGAVPGEPLFALKKISEKSRTFFCSKTEKPKRNLELANKRLEDLNRIAQNNEGRKLAPAINEFQANVSDAARNLSKLERADSEILDQTKKLDENKKKIEEALATKFGEDAYKEYMGAVVGVVENQIKDLERVPLSEEKEKLFEKAKQDFENENYSEALIKIWELSQ